MLWYAKMLFETSIVPSQSIAAPSEITPDEFTKVLKRTTLPVSAPLNDVESLNSYCWTKRLFSTVIFPPCTRISTSRPSTMLRWNDSWQFVESVHASRNSELEIDAVPLEHLTRFCSVCT